MPEACSCRAHTRTLSSSEQSPSSCHAPSTQPTLFSNLNLPPGPHQQNVGNFVTDRTSSRVLAPPGGYSSICFGDANTPAPPMLSPARYGRPPSASPGPSPRAGPPPGALSAGADARADNNYTRGPGGQNSNNWLTGKPSTRVHAPPGGASQIIFG